MRRGEEENAEAEICPCLAEIYFCYKRVYNIYNTSCIVPDLLSGLSVEQIRTKLKTNCEKQTGTTILKTGEKKKRLDVVRPRSGPMFFPVNPSSAHHNRPRPPT